MHYLYYCNSAYQILTVLNLHWHRKYANFENIENYNADIIVLNSFSQAKDIVEILKDSKLFDNVWLVNKTYSNGKFHRLNTLVDFLRPDIYLKRSFNIEKKSVYDRYSVICVPKYSNITAAIWRLNKDAELVLYEDGVSGYNGSMRLRSDSRLYRKFYKRFNYNRDFVDYEKMYVNDARLFAGKDGCLAVDIPTFDKGFLEDVKKMFADYTSVDDLDDKNIYYFAQFLNNKEINIFIDDLLDNMSRYEDQVVYIPHPRHKDEKTYSFAYAKEKQVWELRVLNIDDIDRKLLISIHSTACVTPKILFDREPYILFFYDLCEDVVTARNEKFDIFMEKFIETYRDRDKIMIPKTVEEFFDCIDSYLSKEGINI